MSARRAPVVRLDNLGDVILAGLAVQAVHASGFAVTLLCGPNGRAAADLLPSVDEVWPFRAPWIDPDAHPVEATAIDSPVARIAGAGAGFEQAIIWTRFHQSALPTALLLGMAGVPTVAGQSEDFPGTMLDVRHRPPDDIHEVERNRPLAATLGHHLATDEDGTLCVAIGRSTVRAPFAEPHVVVHPAASVPARAWSPGANRAAVAAGWPVAVTRASSEHAVTAHVAGRHGDRVVDLGGVTDLVGLASVIAGAAAIVVGNGGARHLASAVGRPVVSIYAPNVPAERWHPWRVSHVVLGRQDIGCHDRRPRSCPVPGHPCLASIEPHTVVATVHTLTGGVVAEESGVA